MRSIRPALSASVQVTDRFGYLGSHQTHPSLAQTPRLTQRRSALFHTSTMSAFLHRLGIKKRDRPFWLRRCTHCVVTHFANRYANWTHWGEPMGRAEMAQMLSVRCALQRIVTQGWAQLGSECWVEGRVDIKLALQPADDSGFISSYKDTSTASSYSLPLFFRRSYCITSHQSTCILSIATAYSRADSSSESQHTFHND